MKKCSYFILYVFVFGLLLTFSNPAKSAAVSCEGTCNTDTHNCWRCSYQGMDHVYPSGDKYYCLPKDAPMPTQGTLSVSHGGQVPVTFSGCVTANTSGTYQKQAEEYAQKVQQSGSVMDGCTPLPEKLASISSCLLCPVFDVILKTDQTIATKSFAALAPGFRNLIIIVLALIIAYKTLLAVSALTKQELGKYLGELSVQAFKVLVAVLLLHNSTYIYHYIINPLMEAGLEFGLVLFDDTVKGSLAEQAQASLASMPDGVISKELLSQVMGSLKMFSRDAAELPAIGSSLMCVATHSAATSIGNLPDLSMLIEGAICWAFGWAIAIACCFYLLDSVVRFGIFCSLLPFLIACWPFKITIQFAKTGWDMFMNVFFNFVMMGLVLSLSSQLIAQSLTGGEGGEEAIFAALAGNEVSTIKDLMDLSGTKFLVLVACCIFAFKIVRQINELDDKISSTKGGSEIGNKIGGMAAAVATRAAVDAGKGVAAVTGLKGAAGGVKDRFNRFNDSVRSRIGGGSRTNPNGYISGGQGTSGGNNLTSGQSGNGGNNLTSGQGSNNQLPEPEPQERFDEDTSSYD